MTLASRWQEVEEYIARRSDSTKKSRALSLVT
jgi:hypothetical protein